MKMNANYDLVSCRSDQFPWSTLKKKQHKERLWLAFGNGPEWIKTGGKVSCFRCKTNNNGYGYRIRIPVYKKKSDSKGREKKS